MKAAALDDGTRARWLGCLAVAALGWFLFRQLSIEWSINPQYSYGWVVPALAAYLIWERWNDRPAPTPGKMRWPLVAVLLLLVGFVRLVQEANPDWRLMSWAAALTEVGFLWIGFAAAGGRAWWRHFAFAAAFILVATPWPTPIENVLVQSLMRGVAAVTVEFLNWAGIAAQQEGNLIRLAGGRLGVDEACSGVRSFQGTIMASLFFGELYGLRFTRRVGLLAIGVTLALSLNMLRAILLATIAAKKGIAAVDRWHDPAGYLLLTIIFFALLAAARLLNKSRRSRREEAQPNFPWRSLQPASLVILLTLLFSELATRAWYYSHERNQPKAPPWTAHWPDLPKTEISETVRLILRFNDGQAALWDRPDGSRWHLFFFSWKPGRAAASLARNHRPETCLPSTGFELSQNRGVKIHRAAGLDLPIERLEFQSAGKIWRVYYCLWEDRLSGRAAETSLLTRRARLQAVLEGRRHLGQRVLEVVIGGIDSAERADEAFAEALNNWISVDKS